MAAPARPPLSSDDPKWSMPTEEQIETTIVEQRVLDHFETRHAGLMSMVFNARWRDRDGRPWKPPGPILKLSIRNGGANVKPALTSETIAKIALFECERFARSKGCVVQFHILLLGKGADPDRDDDEDCEDPWRHQVNVRVDGTRAEQEEHEVSNHNPAASPVIDAPQPHLDAEPPAQPNLTETGLVESPRSFGPAADFLSNALARLESKIDYQPGQIFGEMRATLQQQRLEHGAAARDSANVLREAVNTLVRLEDRRVAHTESVIRANADSLLKIVGETNDNMRLLLGELLERDRLRDAKLEAAQHEVREAYKQLAQAGRSETEASGKQAWAAFREGMDMRRDAIRFEVRNEMLEAELARRDAMPAVITPKSTRSWASPLFDKMIDAFPMLALMAGAKFAQSGWQQGASAAIGFFQKLTGQEMPIPDEIPDEQAEETQQQPPPGPVHPGPQHVTPRNGTPHPSSNGAAQHGGNGAPSNGVAHHDASSAPAEAVRPTPPPARPHRVTQPLVANLRRLRASLSAEQLVELQQVIPATAWTGFETAASAELDNVAMAALMPLGAAAQQDPMIEKHVVGLLDTEQAKLFNAITGHLKKAFGLDRPTAAPARPQRASV